MTTDDHDDHDHDHGEARLADLIDDREDLIALRESVYKPLSARLRREGRDVTTNDILPLTAQTDTAYIRPSDLEKATWFARIYETEGEPEIHPRGMHYRILGKGYDRPKGDPYVNDTKSWKDMQTGAFWARVLGFVPAERILDEKNPAPQGPNIRIDSQSGAVRPRTTAPTNPLSPAAAPEQVVDRVLPGFYSEPIPPQSGSPPTVESDIDALIERTAEAIADAVFRNIRFHADQQQAYYIEVWAEKAGLIPERLSDEYGVTRRPAGGGEPSYDMCRSAVEIAAARGQDLVVIMISDFDPKGLDMPKSIARKIEVEAALAEPSIDAHVHHAALTREQAVEHALPTSPAKTPAGLDEETAAARGYEAHKDVFASYAGQEPVEVNAFQAREPEAYVEAIESYIRPYYDPKLSRRLQATRREAREALIDHLSDALADPDLIEAHTALDEAVDAYHDRVADAAPPGFAEQLAAYREAVQEARADLDLDEKAGALKDALRTDPEPALATVAEEIDLPTAETDPPNDAILDTERPLIEQLDAYQEFDVRNN